MIGRPPIGKRAMTGAERHRRYFDRLKAAAAQAQIEETTRLKLQRKNAALRRRIAELEYEIAIVIAMRKLGDEQ